MQFTQEKIVEYLNKNYLALSKDSDEDEKFMFEFLRENNLMTPTPNGLTINNEGQAFVRNAYVFNPVPLNVYDWKMSIIDFLKDGKAMLNVNGNLYRQAYEELIQDDIIEQVGKSYFSTLSSKGRRFINSNISYNDFLNNQYQHLSVNIGKVGHDIHGDVNQTDLSINDQSSEKAIKNNIVPSKRTSFIEYASWIFGIIVALTAIYEFASKHITFK